MEMSLAYSLIFTIIDWHLAHGRSIIATATLSRSEMQQNLKTVYDKYPATRVRILQCVPMSDTPEAVGKLLRSRAFGEGGQKGAVNSAERYFEVKSRFTPIELPHRKIYTWGSLNTLEHELEHALEYIRE